MGGLGYNVYEKQEGMHDGGLVNASRAQNSPYEVRVIDLRGGRPSFNPTKRTRNPRAGGARKGGWIQKADRSMERRGTEGSFTKEAKRHNMDVQQYAAKVVKDMEGKEKAGKKLTAGEKKLLRRAVFARNMGKIAAERKAKK